jgi:ATP-dependent DNA helicase RecG
MPDAPTLVQGGESETVEFKEQWSDHSALRELAAFANTSGGTLLVGVADDGSIVGWQDGDLDALANKITDSLRLHPSEFRIEEVKQEPVLIRTAEPDAQSSCQAALRYGSAQPR